MTPDGIAALAIDGAITADMAITLQPCLRRKFLFDGVIVIGSASLKAGGEADAGGEVVEVEIDDVRAAIDVF